jgi:hypothetical protein
MCQAAMRMVDGEGYGAPGAVAMGGPHTVRQPEVSTVDISTIVSAMSFAPRVPMTIV